VAGEEDLNRKALRAARELSHAATSLASEAANLARALESHHSPDLTIVASKASLDAAQASFAIDDMAVSGSPTLDAVLDRASASVGAAEIAIDAAKRALAEARTHPGRRGGSSSTTA
jgi:hypothetical protein